MDSTALPIQIEIGLSKEDLARIEQLRTAKREAGLKKKGVLAEFQDLIQKLPALFSRVKLKEKVVFFQLLSVMINAGVPIIRSLSILGEQTPNPRLKGIIKDLSHQMEEGKTLSKGMEAHGSVFTEAERGMIASGEASGNLNEILRDIAKQAEKTAMILAKVKGAMIYPAAILTIMVASIFLMLTLVVPKLTALFTEGGVDLPTSTKLLLSLSEGAKTYWLGILALVALALVGFKLVRRSKQGRYSIDWVILYLPIFGKIIRELMISRFARMLSSLTKAGIPIVKALQINANAVGNEVYRRRIQYAAEDVTQGIPLGENLTQSGRLFPASVASMVLVGEQSANLVEVADKIANFYETEVDNAVASLSKLMEPALLIIMGGLVAFLASAIILPIFTLGDISPNL